jgi:hypothetical protein
MAGLDIRSSDKEDKENNNKNNRLIFFSCSLAIINKIPFYYRLKELLANPYPRYTPKNL